MGKDKRLGSIEPYSKRGLLIGLVVGAVVLIFTLLIISYTDELFLVTITWIALIPFFIWLLKKIRSGKPPDEGGGENGEI